MAWYVLRVARTNISRWRSTSPASAADQEKAGVRLERNAGRASLPTGQLVEAAANVRAGALDERSKLVVHDPCRQRGYTRSRAGHTALSTRRRPALRVGWLKPPAATPDRG